MAQWKGSSHGYQESKSGAPGSVLRRCHCGHHHHHGVGPEGAPRWQSGSALVLWPGFASYALSYLFVGVVWINHHHLLRYAENADNLVIWSNLFFLFFVSLIPFFTSYMAENHMNSFTTALYAVVFLLITVAFNLFQSAITRQSKEQAELQASVQAARLRNWIALVVYALAIPAAYVNPIISLALILGVSLLYFVPDAVKRLA
jgi:uncharacterized membrane protein